MNPIPQQPGGSMNDDEMAMMLELAGLAPQQDQINRQRMMAQQLRGMSATPQGWIADSHVGTYGGNTSRPYQNAIKDICQRG